MTPDEIKTALECCLKTNQAYKCTDCRYYNKTANCLRRLMTDTVDVINRQQAEIESLNNKLIEQQLKNNMLYETSLEIKSEAIKEFAETFLEIVQKNHYLLVSQNNSKDYGMFTTGIEQAVNETIKEIEGDENEPKKVY